MFTIQPFMCTTLILLHLLIMTLFQFSTLTTSTKLTQLTLNLTHTLSPNSNVSTFFRPSYINNTLSPEDIRFPLTRNTDFTLTIQVSIGTPPLRMNLLMDTGSALTWAQCKPCKICYTQKYTLYDSLDTTTYKRLPCSNPVCRGAQYKCVKNQCTYYVEYSSGTVIKGIASTETFYFSTGASTSTVPNVIFGCSNEIYRAGSLERSGNIAGIMGLNRSPHSLLTQLFPKQKRRFSYCFAPFYSTGEVGANTVLRFGDDVPTRAPTLQTTPFLPVIGNYHLSLQDISVGNRRLRIPAETFMPKLNGDGGIIIDSGALLPKIENKGFLKGGKPYSTVISAFKQYYSALRLQKIKTPKGLTLELCYRKPAGFNKFASMTYHFRGADYVVDGKYTVVVDERGGYFCVALMPGNKVSVLGSWHQQNMRLVYDACMGVLRFGAEDCAKDRL